MLTVDSQGRVVVGEFFMRLARLYREAVRDLFSAGPLSERVGTDEGLRRVLEEAYADAKAREATVQTDAEATSLSLTVFISAAGLFTFGRRDVLPDIQRCAPSAGGAAVGRLAGVIAALTGDSDIAHEKDLVVDEEAEIYHVDS